MGTETNNDCTRIQNDETKSKELKRISTNGSEENVYVVPLTIEENRAVDGAREILKAIRPDWDLARVQFKMFTDGITNKLVGCFYIPKDDNIDDDNNDADLFSLNQSTGTVLESDLTRPENVVLVRVYGNKTDLLIDRKAETRNIKLLHSYGFAPGLFALFKNGFAYEYVPGITLTSDTVIRPKVWSLVAKRMAEMHNVDCGEKIPREPMLRKKIKSFLDLVPDRFSDPVKHERLKATFLPVQKLRDEFEDLFTQLEKLKSPVVFSHNDLLLTNIIYTESVNSVTFIDYEYAAYNFQAFDIGNHFNEFAGIDEVDYRRYPSKKFQLDWLRVYLETYHQTDKITADDVERLYVQVNQYALASHYFWTLWALIQAEHSTIAFDYVDYAHVRYNEYLAKRDEFLGLNYEN